MFIFSVETSSEHWSCPEVPQHRTQTELHAARRRERVPDISMVSGFRKNWDWSFFCFLNENKVDLMF